MESDKPKQATPKQTLPLPVRTQAHPVLSDESNGPAAAVEAPPSSVQNIDLDKAIHSLTEMLAYFKNLKATIETVSEEETRRVLLQEEASPENDETARPSFASRDGATSGLRGNADSAIDPRGNRHKTDGYETEYLQSSSAENAWGSQEEAGDLQGGSRRFPRGSRRSPRNHRRRKKNTTYGYPSLNNMNEVDFVSGTGRNVYTSDTLPTGQPNACPPQGNGSPSTNQKPSPRDGSWKTPGPRLSSASGTSRYFDSNEPLHGFPAPEAQPPLPGSESDFVGFFDFPEFDGLQAVAGVQSAQAILAYPNQLLSFENRQAYAFVPNGFLPPQAGHYYGQVVSTQQSAIQQYGNAYALSLSRQASSANLSFYPPQQRPSHSDDSLYEALARVCGVYPREEE